MHPYTTIKTRYLRTGAFSFSSVYQAHPRRFFKMMIQSAYLPIFGEDQCMTNHTLQNKMMIQSPYLPKFGEDQCITNHT